MKRNLIIKIFALLTVILIIGGVFFLSANATFDPATYNPGRNNQKPEQLTNIAGIVLGAINVVGIFISVGMLMIIGIKYMMGSIEEKARYKETIYPYLIGAILLSAGTTFVNVIYQLAKKWN